MLDSASKRLVDAQNEDLDADSQFDLAYGAAHRFALDIWKLEPLPNPLAALKMLG